MGLQTEEREEEHGHPCGCKKNSQFSRSAGSCSGCTELEGVLFLGGTGWKPDIASLGSFLPEMFVCFI